MKSTFWKDFKAFITKGNIIDMATGVVVGGAFGKISTGLVNNIIMPLISLAVGGLNVSDWKWVIKEAEFDAAGVEIAAETAVMYGAFIQTIIDFLLTAFCIFVVLRIIVKAKARMNADEIAAAEEKKKAEEAAAKAKADEEAAAKAAAEAKAKADAEEQLQLLRDIAAALNKKQ